MRGRVLHPRIDDLGEAIWGIAEGVAAAARAGHQRYRRMRRKPRGGTLRPGAGTPLWNELRRKVHARVLRRGEKVLLARELGLPRQRVHEFLRASSAMPDAERTLRLLEWVSRRDRLRRRALSRNT